MTVALLGTTKSYEDQYKEILKIENSDLYKRFYKSNGQQRSTKDILNEYGIDANDKATQERFARYGIRLIGQEKGNAVDALADAWDGVRSSIKGATDYWNADGQAFMDSLFNKAKKAGAAMRVAGNDFDSTPWAEKQINVKYNASLTEETEANIRAGKPSPVDFGAAGGNIKAAGYGVQDMQSALAEQRKSQAESLQVEVNALDMFTASSTAAYEAIITGSGGASKAFLNMAKQQLTAFGIKETAEAISQVAQGFSALANPLTAPLATMHFTSAAKHAAAAAIAGVGVAAIGSIGGGGGSSASAGGSSGGSRPSFGNSQQPAGGERIIVLMGDSNGNNSPRMEYLNAKRVADLAFGGDGVTNR